MLQHGDNQPPAAAEASELDFVKYTSCGNSFVLLDEVHGPLLSEAAKAQFAYYATNACFGVGADNLLVVQRCSREVLESIGAHAGYWPTVPEAAQADFVFRMFEPNGKEAFSCGNGLMCIADHLFRRHGVTQARILTEIPLATPKTVTIGRHLDEADCWVNMGRPRRTPPEMVASTVISGARGTCDYVAGIRIPFRAHDLHPYSAGTEIVISGYLVFTGEPHLVVNLEDGFSIPELAGTLFNSPAGRHGAPGASYVRVNRGSWLIQRIGSFINTRLTGLFPSGLNINFIRPIDERTLEYRCFERGINRETLACGTGAVAAAVVAWDLGYLSGFPATILPHRCRRHQPQARLLVASDAQGWRLRGMPSMLFQGSFVTPLALGQCDPRLALPITDTGENLVITGTQPVLP